MGTSSPCCVAAEIPTTDSSPSGKAASFLLGTEATVEYEICAVQDTKTRPNRRRSDRNRIASNHRLWRRIAAPSLTHWDRTTQRLLPIPTSVAPPAPDPRRITGLPSRLLARGAVLRRRHSPEARTVRAWQRASVGSSCRPPQSAVARRADQRTELPRARSRSMVRFRSAGSSTGASTAPYSSHHSRASCAVKAGASIALRRA